MQALGEPLTMRPNFRSIMPGVTRWVSSHTAINSTCRNARWSPQAVAA
jgi:hypothetical protein